MERTMLVREAAKILDMTRQGVHEAIKRGDLVIAGVDHPSGWLLLYSRQVREFAKEREAARAEREMT